MDKASITTLYEDYKKARSIQKEVESYKHEFDMTVQGVKSTYTFTKHGDAESLHKMIESMSHFVEKFPIGKLMIQYHKPGFTLMEHVIKAINANDNEITRTFDSINSEMKLFEKNAPDSIKATLFNPKELQQGPISYCLYLTAKENAFGDVKCKQIILSFVALMTSRAESIIYNLDKLLSLYINLYEKYTALYKQCKQIFEDNEKKGGISAAFSQRASVDIELASSAPGNNMLDNLIKNRNQWAFWLSKPERKRNDYFRNL